MLRNLLLMLVATIGWQAQAAYQCNVKPQDDVIIQPQQVQVVGASGDLRISPNGDLQRNGSTVALNAAQRQQAQSYQAALRQTLPWIDQGAREHLEKARVALDRVIVQELGSESNVRNRLTTLNDQLKQQMSRIIEPRSDGLAFHHQAITLVEQDGRRIVEQSMGGVLQDSLNEMGIKQATSGNNPLQALMGNLGGLQQAIRNEWSNQEQDFQKFGNEACQRVIQIEQQRKALLAALPQ